MIRRLLSKKSRIVQNGCCALLDGLQNEMPIQRKYSSRGPDNVPTSMKRQTHIPHPPLGGPVAAAAGVFDYRSAGRRLFFSSRLGLAALQEVPLERDLRSHGFSPFSPLPRFPASREPWLFYRFDLESTNRRQLRVAGHPRAVASKNST